MRKNGVLMHISSLPSDYGIGTLGKEAYNFVDSLARTGQSYWQILPVCPTGFGDSPYASYSTFAGNPYFIDLDLLEEDGLLKKEEYANLNWGENPEQVDFGLLYNQRYPVLEKAAERLQENLPADYEKFVEDNAYWLDDYALFMALKDFHSGKNWLEWDKPYGKYDAKKAKEWAKEHKDRVDYYKSLQYLFYKQWHDLRKYANENGVEIIGDLPIYVALDSVDAWSHPELFALDKDGKPAEVAGCPPDGFSADGQLWGNPLYDWDYHKKTDFAWWISRIKHLTNLYNVLRIDHFRGFDSYYAIPYGAENARKGEWKKGPGKALFETMEKTIGTQNIIAEDLGYLTDSVRDLLASTGFPGMKILQFGFDSRDGSGAEYLPYNYPKNSFAYAGTHDNATIKGWFEEMDEQDSKYAQEYMRAYYPESRAWDVMRTVVASPSDTSILQMQDLLSLGNESRMNTPGKAGGNWTWRMKKGAFDKGVEDGLYYLTKLYGRIVPKKEEPEEADEKDSITKEHEQAADSKD
jgi:4-alpha-glucanotransferase